MTNNWEEVEIEFKCCSAIAVQIVDLMTRINVALSCLDPIQAIDLNFLNYCYKYINFVPLVPQSPHQTSVGSPYRTVEV
ncbi:MAG: hypothetical protein AAGF83_11430 [Cyanobacteria bacterium P01_G01_bin.67]